MNFKPKTLSDLNHFIGKVCTIFLAGKDQSVLTIVRHIDDDGIWGQHPQNETAIFIPTGHYTMIGEEIVLDPQVPEHAKLIEKYEEDFGNKKTKAMPPEKKKDEVAFVDIRQLGNLARQTKQNYDNRDKSKTIGV